MKKIGIFFSILLSIIIAFQYSGCGKSSDDNNTSTENTTDSGTTTTTTATCGNGTVETGEQCDDGNTNSYDGCNATCQTETSYSHTITIDGDKSDWDSEKELLGDGFGDGTGTGSDVFVMMTLDSSNFYFVVYDHNFADGNNNAFNVYFDIDNTSTTNYAYDYNGGSDARVLPFSAEYYAEIYHNGSGVQNLFKDNGSGWWNGTAESCADLSSFVGYDSTHTISELKIPFSCLGVTSSSTVKIAMFLTDRDDDNVWATWYLTNIKGIGNSVDGSTDKYYEIPLTMYGRYPNDSNFVKP